MAWPIWPPGSRHPASSPLPLYGPLVGPVPEAKALLLSSAHPLLHAIAVSTAPPVYFSPQVVFRHSVCTRLVPRESLGT